MNKTLTDTPLLLPAPLVAVAEPAGVQPQRYLLFDGEALQVCDDVVIEEGLAGLYVNGRPWVRLMCTPHDLDELALGLLRSEGVIAGMEEVAGVAIAPNGRCVDILLRDAGRELPQGLIITTGCGGGATFSHGRAVEVVRSTCHLSPEQVCSLMQQLRGAAVLYRRARGVHTSALSDGSKLLLVAEDVGRHNTIDRLWGKAMKQGVETAGRVLLTTGRVSSEMLRKAAGMQTPIVISRTSPTSLSVTLAETAGITLVGYVRRNSFRVYTVSSRICPTHPTAPAATARLPVPAS
ncbi:MAG: formate dehydrogenase accessory sulfurtransferase FdhD [Caldilineae bacterium]|nr:MAG: formate dehydrogenase accessory sulfurtransferase FdhD [Caldilineae bacterium]